jgi:hypothetical protein
MILFCCEWLSAYIKSESWIVLQRALNYQAWAHEPFVCVRQGVLKSDDAVYTHINTKHHTYVKPMYMHTFTHIRAYTHKLMYICIECMVRSLMSCIYMHKLWLKWKENVSSQNKVMCECHIQGLCVTASCWLNKERVSVSWSLSSV